MKFQPGDVVRLPFKHEQTDKEKREEADRKKRGLPEKERKDRNALVILATDKTIVVAEFSTTPPMGRPVLPVPPNEARKIGKMKPDMAGHLFGNEVNKVALPSPYLRNNDTRIGCDAENPFIYGRVSGRFLAAATKMIMEEKQANRCLTIPLERGDGDIQEYRSARANSQGRKLPGTRSIEEHKARFAKDAQAEQERRVQARTRPTLGLAKKQEQL